MPVQQPPQPLGAALPPQPQDPPTLDDVVRAKFYQARVEKAIAEVPDGPTEDDDARADIYKTNIIMAHSALAAPAWFVPAMNVILAPIRSMLAKTRNQQLLDGSVTPFEIVPFTDGSMPTDVATHNLPPLVDVTAIRALTAVQATAYANGYGLPPIPQAVSRKMAVGKAVGCSVIL